MKKQEIEEIMERRAFMPHRDDLAARIIMASSRVDQKVDIKLSNWLKNVFAEFMLPKPVYAFASILTIGVMLGVNFVENDISVSTASVSVQQDIFSDDGASL